MKKIALKNAARGTAFDYAGQSWILLENDDGRALCLSKDIIAGENRATAFRYEASPICRASFPSTLDEDGARCTVEVTVYRLNAVAVTAYLLDGPETLLRHIGLDERDTYTTKHEIDDLVTVVHITRLEGGGTA